jgi:hypothetical protein
MNRIKLLRLVGAVSVGTAIALGVSTANESYPNCDGTLNTIAGSNPTWCQDPSSGSTRTYCVYLEYKPPITTCGSASGSFTGFDGCIDWSGTTHEIYWTCNGTACTGTAGAPLNTRHCECASPTSDDHVINGAQSWLENNQCG